MSAIAARSATLSCGLPIVSTYNAFVFGRIAGPKFPGSSLSTNVASMPNCANVTASCVYVPPYSVRDATT